MAKPAPKGIDSSAPAWLVTFGDLNSLLLTFFILLFSMSEIKKSRLYEFTEAVNDTYKVESTLPDTPQPASRKVSFKQILQSMGDRFSTSPAKGGTEVENPFGPDTHVTHVQEGLRVRMGGRVLFDQGTEALMGDGKKVLRDLADYVRGIPNKLDVRGHAASGTDDFDLACRRAETVARFLIEQAGIPQERMRISSAGPNEPAEGSVYEAEGIALRDRVEVIVSEEHVNEPGADYEEQ